MRRSVIQISILCASVFSFSACSTMGVEAWERDILAKDEMQLVARGFGGGGCGCN